jgi:polygalacturonase
MEKLTITEFGAQEGILSTNQIQEALNKATQLGGVTVVIPRGTFITGTLNMGRASLYLEKGAVLKGSGDPKDYYPNGFTHNEMKECTSMLYSFENDDISISGEGTIDLNAMAFYDNVHDIPDYGIGFSEEQIKECTLTYQFRPTQPIFFYHCNNIKIHGIRIINAPCWTLSFNQCENVRVTELTIDNDPTVPNNDGMHFCGCKHVFVRGCNITSGDDCIALSGITDWDIPCEDVIISDCILRSSSKAIVLGYMHSIIRNIVISNCIIRDSHRALCIMTSDRTGLIEHVLVENMRLDTRVHAGNWWGNGEPICIFALHHDNVNYLFPAPERDWPVNITDIQFKGMSCSGENVIGIIGDKFNIQNILLDGITMNRKDSPNRALKGDRVIDVSPSKAIVKLPEDENEYWIHLQGCKNITAVNIELSEYHGKKMKTSMKDCENITVDIKNV